MVALVSGVLSSSGFDAALIILEDSFWTERTEEQRRLNSSVESLLAIARTEVAVSTPSF